MRPSSSRKQLLLFLGAVVVPSGLVLSLALRADRHAETSRRQAAQEKRQQAARQVANQLRLTLDRIRLTAASDPATLANDRSVVAVWPIGCARLLLPRCPGSNGAERRGGASAAVVRRAEAAEFRGQADSAVALYREALERESDSSAAAAIRLSIARALRRVGRNREAIAIHESLVRLPPEIRDEDGIPVALYAADQLSGSPPHRAIVAEQLAVLLESRRNVTALGAHMLYSVAAALGDDADEGLLTLAREHVARTERLAALDRDLPALLRFSGAPPAGGRRWESQWVATGDPLWLVAAQSSLGGDDTVVIAVEVAALSADVGEALHPVVPTPIRIARLDTDASAEPLGADLATLGAVMDVVVDPERPSIGVPLIVFVLSLAGLAAYLLWRDVRRETHAAAVRSRFVSGVSHELKTPLTSIRMFAEMMRMHPGDVHRRDSFLGTIVGESERLSRLIENVLHFSRVDERRQRYHLSPASIQEVVREAAAAMEYPMSQAGLTLLLELDDGMPPVAVDRDAITNAVLNLLSNAVKFSPEGGTIELRVERADGAARIIVRDAGVGIAPEEQQRIFEEFYRSPDAEARGIEGTGLGLALVSDVAGAHGGAVEVASAPGAGSAFTITIPMEGAR